MRLERLSIRGLGPFREESEIDLRALDGARIVAVVGPNGAGKSTALELFPGALYRQAPTRGSLAGLAVDRAAYVEAEVVNGQRYRIRQTVDGVSGKGEASVIDADGVPLVESGKVRAYDAWAATYLPPPEVLYASTFAVQGRGGFLEMKPADRKAVLLRVLGVERLEALAELGRERARRAKEDLRVVEARLGDARCGALAPEDAETELQAARTAAAAADEDRASARAALEQAQERRREVELAVTRAREVRERRAALNARIRDLRARREDLEERARNNRTVLERGDEIRAAVARAEELDTALKAADSAIARLSAERAEHVAGERRARDAAAAAEGRADRAAERAGLYHDRLLDRHDVENAAAGLESARSDMARAEAWLRDVEDRYEELRGRRLAGAEDRIVKLRAGLERIESIARDAGGDAVVVAQKTLTDDDEMARAARQFPSDLENADRDLRQAREELDRAKRSLARRERLAARASEMEAAAADLSAAKREEREAREEAAGMREDAAQAAQRAAGVDVGAAEAERQRMAQERAELAPRLKLAGPLAQAEARIAELTRQLDEVMAELERAEAEAAALPPAEDAPPVPDVAGPEEAVRTAEERSRQRHADVVLAERALDEARAVASRVAELQAERARLDEALADWTRLAQDLGRDGLQAAEIDAAGPELTELVNDLLHGCVSRRWTVTIETTRRSADGKKQIEGCDVRVLDTERGRDAPVETFSGGERVLIGEAVSLALSVLACRRAGVEAPTLVRDESGAALDPVNGRAYVAMLRRAADMIGASQVLFVSHAPELQELADARIRVDGGRIVIEEG